MFKIIIIILLVALIGAGGWYYFYGSNALTSPLVAENQSTAKPLDRVVIGVKSAPLGFYGQSTVEYENPTFNFNANIFDGLTTFTKDLKRADKQLAKSWTNPNETTWRLKLQEGVMFHNGQPFTADDAKASLDFAKTYVVADELAFVKEVKIVDKYTLEIQTSEPFPLLLNNLINVFILPKSVIDAKSFDTPIGTGPYKFVKTEGDMHYLEANESYYQGKPAVKEVVYKVIDDNNDRVDAIISGDVDIIEDVPFDRIDDIKAAQLEHKVLPSLRVIFLGMKTNDSPFSKLLVRQAVYKAINEEQIIKQVMGSHATIASQPATPVNFGFNTKVARPGYDPEGAKTLLTQAGYPDGFAIELNTPNNRYVNDEAVAKAVAADLTKVGIVTTVNAEPKDDYFKRVLDDKNTSFYLLGWSQDNGDAGGAYGTLLHTVEESGYGSFNIGGYSNPTIDQLIEKSDVTVDPIERGNILEELAQVTMADVPIIPLHQQEDSFALNKKLKWTPRRDNGIRGFEISGN